MCCARVGRRAIGLTHMFFTIQNWRHLSEQRLVFFSSGIWFVAFCLNFCFISTRILVQVCVANCIDIHPRGLRMHAWGLRMHAPVLFKYSKNLFK